MSQGAGLDSGDSVHWALEDAGIEHICHDKNPWGISDLSMAAICCTECRIWRGEVSLEDVISGKDNPLDIAGICDRAYQESKKLKESIVRGKRSRHELNVVLQTGGWLNGEWHERIDPPIKYERVDCILSRSSFAVPSNRICHRCGYSVDS